MIKKGFFEIRVKCIAFNAFMLNISSETSFISPHTAAAPAPQGHQKLHVKCGKDTEMCIFPYLILKIKTMSFM